MSNSSLLSTSELPSSVLPPSFTVSEIYVRPCVNGNSSTGEFFNYSVLFSRCNGENCTALSTQQGASMVSPILLSLTGISGQIAALIYLHHSSRPSNHRTTFYVMLATLIWTDLIGKVITTPLPVLSYVYGHWVGGINTCKLHGYSMSTIGIVTHLLVAVMAFERYLGIRCGYFYNRNVTTSRTRTLLISLWLFGALYCSLPLMGIGEFKLHYPGSWCHINQHICRDHPWPNRLFSNFYSTINLGCLFIIVICNLIVVGTLLKMRVTKYRPSKSCRQMASKKPREREIQMVILLVIITVTFICSWAPHDVLMFKNQLWPPPPNRNPLLDMRAIRLVSINQIVDPWSYIICRIIFRSKLWGCCRSVIIGKMGSRRFTSRTSRDESSGFYSIGGPKRKFSSLKKMQKRTSLPNPSELTNRQGAMQKAKRRDKELFSFDNCSSDQDCKIDLQSCFTAQDDSNKKSPISSAFEKLLHCSATVKDNYKEDSYLKVGSLAKFKSRSGGLLLPYDEVMPADGQGFTYPKKILIASFHGKTAMEETNDTTDGTLNDGDAAKDPLLAGNRSTSRNLPVRSNSWCCSDEFTSASTRKLKFVKPQQLESKKY